MKLLQHSVKDLVLGLKYGGMTRQHIAINWITNKYGKSILMEVKKLMEVILFCSYYQINTLYVT